jgi:IS30 family transposase
MDGRIAPGSRTVLRSPVTEPRRSATRSLLTWGQGAEMAQHAQLRIDTGLQVYFCDPQSPWQRATNENTHGLLRQYFPKGTDLGVPRRGDSPSGVTRLPATSA